MQGADTYQDPAEARAGIDWPIGLCLSLPGIMNRNLTTATSRLYGEYAAANLARGLLAYNSSYKAECFVTYFSA